MVKFKILSTIRERVDLKIIFSNDISTFSRFRDCRIRIRHKDRFDNFHDHIYGDIHTLSTIIERFQGRIYIFPCFLILIIISSSILPKVAVNLKQEYLLRNFLRFYYSEHEMILQLPNWELNGISRFSSLQVVSVQKYVFKVVLSLTLKSVKR